MAGAHTFTSASWIAPWSPPEPNCSRPIVSEVAKTPAADAGQAAPGPGCVALQRGRVAAEQGRTGVLSCQGRRDSARHAACGSPIAPACPNRLAPPAQAWPGARPSRRLGMQPVPGFRYNKMRGQPPVCARLGAPCSLAWIQGQHAGRGAHRGGAGGEDCAGEGERHSSTGPGHVCDLRSVPRASLCALPCSLPLANGLAVPGGRPSSATNSVLRLLVSASLCACQATHGT